MNAANGEIQPLEEQVGGAMGDGRGLAFEFSRALAFDFQAVARRFFQA